MTDLHSLYPLKPFKSLSGKSEQTAQARPDEPFGRVRQPKSWNVTATNVSRNRPKVKKRTATHGEARARQKCAERSGFALNFLCFFLCFKTKKEKGNPVRGLKSGRMPNENKPW